MNEERVSTLTGDRLCQGCGYNLTGQMIVREPHYKLLIVRCPECGTVTSVHEYPTLGRWGARLGVALAALWFLFMLAAWGGSAGAVCAFAIATGEEAARPYSYRLRELYRDDTQAAQAALATQAAPTTPTSQATPTVVTGAGTTVQVQGNPAATAMRQGLFTATTGFDQWYASKGPAQLFAESGGFFGAVDVGGLWLWVPTALVGFAIGWFWSIALLQFRRRGVLVWLPCIVLLGALFTYLGTADWFRPPVRSHLAGRAEIGGPVMLATLAFSAVAIGAGMLLGRPLTRMLVRGLLAPRLRGPLAGLWTAEGLEPPKPR